ncbi:MAG: glycosyltransferase family 2 protein [Pseudomonadota bacterium]
MTSRTHIILVNWNGAVDTIACLEALLRLEGNFTVTVCDNGSTDGSVARIEAWANSWETRAPTAPAAASMTGPCRWSPTVRTVGPSASSAQEPHVFLTIIEAGENLGFAGGNNLGIHLALQDPDCEYIWILNNDTVPAPDALTALIARMDDPAVAVCGSTLIYHDDPDRVQALGGRHFLLRARGEPIGAGLKIRDLPDQATVEAELDYVVGASLFTRKSVMARTGGLSEAYFLYFEELDLARRLAPGERLGWAPQSIVYHKEGASIGTSSRARPSATSVYYLRQALLRFYAIHHPLLLPFAMARILREGLGDLFRGDLRATGATLRAAWDFVRKRPPGPIMPKSRPHA